MGDKKLLSKVWGLWEPDIKGETGSLTIGQKDSLRITFSEITIYDYIDFINDLQQDLGQSKALLDRMDVQLKGEAKDEG